MMIDFILFHNFPDLNPDSHSQNKDLNVVPDGNFKMFHKNNFDPSNHASLVAEGVKFNKYIFRWD